MSDADDGCLCAAIITKEQAVEVLREAIEAEGSQTTFARAHGLQPSDVCSALRGRRTLTPRILAAINVEWVYVHWRPL